MSLTLHIVKEVEGHGKFPSPYDAYCALVARYSNVELEFNEMEVGEGKDNHEEEFAKKTPTKNVPVLEVPQKGTIWESNAIANYLVSTGNNHKLRGGNDSFKAAQIDQLIELISLKWGPIQHLVLSGYGVKKISKPELKDAETGLQYLNGVLDHILTNETFLVGNSLTLADLLLFSRYRPLFEKVWEPEERVKAVPKSVLRWFLMVSNQPEVIEVVGQVKLKEKIEKKIESKFNLEDWKRFYMNSPPDQYIEYFWKNLDVRVNSVWISNYKYPEELKRASYLTGNLMGGVQQRAQPFNKTTFGVLLMTGTEQQQHITCLWVFESPKGVPKEYQETIDFELFDFKRIDWKEDREKVNLYLKSKNDSSITIDGKAILEIKRLL